MSNKLMSYLPNYYRTSKVITDITNTQDSELKEFSDKIGQILNQFFIDKSDFTLERWEKELGLAVNNNKPEDYRRSVIKSKLRGHGTVTIKFIKNISESYANGEVDIIEDHVNYSFTIKFVGTKGIPPNLDDLKQTIEEIKPAHLGVDYEFTYTTWGELQGLNWEELKLSTWQEVKTREVL